MSDRYFIAIDIGTTNIEAALVRVDPDGIGTADTGHAAPESESDDTGTVDLSYGEQVAGNDHSEKRHRIMSTILQPNMNRKFGRDVMTRITQAERGNLHQMSTDLRQQLLEIIRDLIRDVSTDEVQKADSSGSDDDDRGSKEERSGAVMVDINRIIIACNTTMTHILLEEDCHNLGVYPFSPVHTERVDIMSNELDIQIGPAVDREHASYEQRPVGSDSAGSQGCHPVPVTVLPGFSAFVGGDIVSGVISLGLFDRPGKSLLIDLGTNGEIVYHDHDTGRTLITSTAAGPAFELAGRARATEIIAGIAELRSKGIIDETGLLADEYFEIGCMYGEVNITQQLVRDVQAAKAAVRAGIEIILNKAAELSETGHKGEHNGEPVLPDRVFLAGAFGENLDMDAAITIGMLPESFRDRITLCGNTSLSGAIRAALELSGPFREYSVISSYEEIILANESGFNDLYIGNMGL